MIKKIFILSIILIMGLGYFNTTFSFAKKNVDLFDEIIKITEATPIEYGVRTCIETKKDSETYSLEILRKLNIELSSTNIIKDNNIYCVEFNNSELNGYVESISYKNYNVVTINIVKKDSKNGLSQLKALFEKALEEEDKEIKYFQYLKAAIPSNNISRTNEEIAELLKRENALNIDTIELENGYSTVAYTKRYPIMKNNGKYMDFNYAVCSYSSGNYIIIGTPIIITTY
ncbi:YwmB family TATA-box binding protein [Clostridium sp. SYSU_GA19001]|uniref:YwmB family TATA-box binding protein n=1 Tax=Clostridium caldaquaticum TaxID=2940653 RepID=UPI00207713C5|nr:YwmB family TATA-box binding protein [Clostridium caldaquaticum]MCM8709740.1 YwmB family TATA-box binding protein [Clostridium caldaquaticum]